MTFKVGDRVRYIEDGDVGPITHISDDWIVVEFEEDGKITVLPEDLELIASAVNPNHYVFPGGVEVRQISAHLTSFGGQAVQYVARATRLDGQNKGEAVEDLKKAIKFLTWEIERIEESE